MSGTNIAATLTIGAVLGAGWQPSEISALDISDFVNYLLLIKEARMTLK